MDNNLSIHFCEVKTKPILFASKRRSKNVRQLNFRYNNINIKQDSQVTYLGCVLNKRMSCEPIAIKVINKTNGELKFIYRKNKYLTKQLCRMQCYNALILPHFDYECTAWYPNLNEKTKKKTQIMQNKSIRFCLKLDKMYHMSKEEFKLINWLPNSKRIDH